MAVASNANVDIFQFFFSVFFSFQIKIPYRGCYYVFDNVTQNMKKNFLKKTTNMVWNITTIHEGSSTATHYSLFFI